MAMNRTTESVGFRRMIRRRYDKDGYDMEIDGMGALII